MQSRLALSPFWGLAVSGVVMAGAVLAPQPEKDPELAKGEAVYKARCMSCHGDQGQGGTAYPRPLKGSKSVEELSRYIQRNMPPKGKRLSEGDSRLVGAFIHDAFYSPLAQERNRPARIALSRLTVRQYQNAVSELLSDGETGIPREDGKGLKGQYFKSPWPDDKQKAIDRIDAKVAFDFQAGTPGPEITDPYKFGALWTGSVLAPDTGEYDFVVRSNQSVVLHVNNMEQPLIDRSVVSGTDTEHRATLTLLGGRTYNLKLVFSKATQGVESQDKTRQKPPAPAFVALHWKRPRLAEEPIPARYLYPEWTNRKFVSTAPFPPDDKSIGYERGTFVNKEWDDAATSAALEAAVYASAHIDRLAGTQPEAGDRKEKIAAWGARLVERAFRRPLSPEEKSRHIDRPLSAPDLAEGVKRMVILALKSPRFLYREIEEPGQGQWTTAANLSFGLWDSLPDEALRRAAAEGRLASPEQIRAEASRMAEDVRAWTKLRGFYLGWLKVEEAPDLIKDKSSFPEFTPEMASDLRASLELFLDENGRDGDDTFGGLFLAQKFPVNDRLAKTYGVSVPPGGDFSWISLNPEERIGLLGHPYLLSRLAYLQTTSPIHRGVLLSRSIMGRSLRPPPAAFAPVAPDLHPSLTTRERVAMQTRSRNCMSCHAMINPLGFSLERFDAIGRLQTKEKGKAIDSTGGYESKSGEKVSFSGPRDLAAYVARADDSHSAFVEKLFHHLVKQPVRAYGADRMDQLTAAFRQSGGSIRQAMVEIMASTAGARSAPEDN